MREGAPPDEIRGLLAITFTNAAAGEMKERILSLLKRIALDSFEDQRERRDILGSLPLSPEVARGRARALVDYLLLHFSYFQVRTIDSLVNLLLAGCARELGLSAGFSTRTDHRDCLEYGLDECVDDALRSAPVEKLLLQFLTQYLHIENRSGWLPKNDIFGQVEGLYEHANALGGKYATSGLEPAALHDRRTGARTMLDELARRCPEGTDARFRASLARYLTEHPRRLDMAGLTSRYFTRESFPINKGYEVPDDVARLWTRLRNGLAAVARDEARSIFDCYVEIFSIVMGHFRRRAREEEAVFLGELNRLASELFEEGRVSVPDIYYRLAGRYRHYLIDEFQDTSRLQWENLSAMVEEALATGGTLFYVGDKKQAIYRFRGGDVSLFDRVPEALPSAPVHMNVLRANHRSRRQIVMFNNAIFSEENLRRYLSELGEAQEGDRWLAAADLDALLSMFRNSRQAPDSRLPHGCVRVEHVECSDRSDRTEAVRGRLMGCIRELLKRFAAEEIAILARENDEVELVTGWLVSEGVPVASDKTLDIRNHPLIKEIVSFLSFLNAPIDDLSFASFILGDIFCRATGLRRGGVEDFLLDVMRTPAGGRYLYRAFRDRHPETWDAFIDEFFRSAGFVPLYELALGIMERFGVFRAFPDAQGFLMRLLELILERTEDEEPGIAEFLRYYERGSGEDFFVKFTDVNAVKVMTVHKSKGRQFPAVVIPFLDFTSWESISRRESGKAPYTIVSEGEARSLLRLDAKYARFSEEVRNRLRETLKNALLDGLNITYVACTRARSELRLFVPCTEGRSGCARLIPPECTAMGAPRAYGARRPGRSGRPLPIPVQHYGSWAPLLEEEHIDPCVIIRRADVRRGELLHYALSRIGALREGEEARAVGAAVEMARLQFAPRDDFGEVESVLKAVLAHPRARPFFFTGDNVHTELEIVDPIGRARRIDRLVAGEGEVRIVDYKSSEADITAHRVQMREYAGIIGEIYPGRKVRCFLVFLDEVRVEEVGG
jgi:ATP-dependent exoDNAse (exonuclease V) beta subunit